MIELVFTIYKLTNLVNGKVYVGQTRYKLERRWQGHVRSALSGRMACRVMQAALRKYGPGAFSRTVLCTARTQEEANTREAEWIQILGCRVPDGYNLSPGGGVKGAHPETRKLMSEAAKIRMAKMSPEERRELARVASAAVPYEHRVNLAKMSRDKTTPQQRSLAALKRQAAKTPERRKEIITKGNAKRSQALKRAWAAKTKEQRAAIAAKAIATLTPEQRSERVRLGRARMTPERRAEIAKIASDAAKKAHELRLENSQ